MNSKLRVFVFRNGFRWALAKDIEDYAVSKGWRIKVDCNGQRHPGTICNEHIKRIIKSNNLRRHFQWHSDDVSSMHTKNIENYPILNDLIDKEIINYSNIKNGYLDVYNMNAVRVIISCMIQDIDFTVPEEDIVEDTSYQNLLPDLVAHKWETKKLNTKVLFRINSKVSELIKPKPMQSFLEANFNEEEKAAIRKYQRLIRETRENGTRPYSKRNNPKEDKNNG